MYFHESVRSLEKAKAKFLFYKKSDPLVRCFFAVTDFLIFFVVAADQGMEEGKKEREQAIRMKEKRKKGKEINLGDGSDTIMQIQTPSDYTYTRSNISQV